MTGISWTDATWNPVRGCSRVSEGCRHCYAEVQAARIVRMGASSAYKRLVRLTADGEPRWTGVVELDAATLAKPLRWRKPKRVFVNSMSDLFHESLTNEQIAAVFGVMAACPQHTFQILTKRARRMRAWFEWLDDQIEGTAEDLSGAECAVSIHTARDWSRLNYILDAARGSLDDAALLAQLERVAADAELAWPLANVWLGVSVENQAARERLDDLRACPAAVRMISFEPLLEDLGSVDLTGMGWAIAGCESGPGARHCYVAWLRSLRDQCAAASVPFFLK